MHSLLLNFWLQLIFALMLLMMRVLLCLPSWKAYVWRLPITIQPSLVYPFFVILRNYLIFHNTHWTSKFHKQFIQPVPNKLADIVTPRHVKSTAFVRNYCRRYEDYDVKVKVENTRHVTKCASGIMKSVWLLLQLLLVTFLVADSELCNK